MGTGPRTHRVDGPRLRQPTVGSLVLSALDPIALNTEEEDGDWQNGFEYLPRTCTRADITDPCSVEAFTHADQPEIVVIEPFMVRAGEQCSALSFGSRRQQLQDRAREALLACESAEIAHELWTGTQAAASGWPNRSLASLDSDVLTDGPTSLTHALACLEEGLRSRDGCRCGQQGMIHASAQTITHWTALNLIHLEGQTLRTILGTVVVADAGYDGSGPEGQAAVDGSVWAYSTGLVEVRRGPIHFVPPELDSALDRDVNTLEFLAQRAAAASWDGCCHFAVEIDMEVCDFGGLGS